MRRLKVFLLLFGIAAISLFVVNGKAQTQKPSINDVSGVDQQRVVKVTIAALDPSLGPPTHTYRRGEKIAIGINLTNTSDVPVYSCLTGDLYQDLPRLKRDDKEVPYTSWQSYALQTAAKNQTCANDDIPASTLLPPNTSTLVDSLTVSDDNLDPTGHWPGTTHCRPGITNCRCKDVSAVVMGQWLTPTQSTSMSFHKGWDQQSAGCK